MKKLSLLALILLVAVVFCTGCEGNAEAAQQSTSETTQSTSEATQSTDVALDKRKIHNDLEPPIDRVHNYIPDPYNEGIDIDSEPSYRPEEEVLFVPPIFSDPNYDGPSPKTDIPEDILGIFLDDRCDIPYDDFQILIDSLMVEDGTYVICGGKAAFCQKGREIYTWESETYFDDFLFQIDGEVYAKMGGCIVHFVDEDMYIMASAVAECEWTGINFYCYYLVGDGELHFWSPTNDCYIASDVRYTHTTNKHTFYEAKNGDIYVINADPYAIMRVSPDYVYAHPVPVVRLGEGPMWNYYDQLEPNGEENDRKAAIDFDNYYGLDLLAWGND